MHSTWRASFWRAQRLVAFGLCARLYKVISWTPRSDSLQVFLISDQTHWRVLRYEGIQAANIISRAFRIVLHLERVNTAPSCGLLPLILSYFSAEVNRCFVGRSLGWMHGCILKGEIFLLWKALCFFPLFSFFCIVVQYLAKEFQSLE